MVTMILVIVSASCCFVIPVVFRKVLEWLQAMAAVILLSIVFLPLEGLSWLPILFIMWVMGSLCAASIRISDVKITEKRSTHQYPYRGK
jgi:hypothetical protein